MTELDKEGLEAASRAISGGGSLMEQTCGLRDMGYIAAEPYDEDQHGRFGPPDVITPAGRAALAGAKS